MIFRFVPLENFRKKETSEKVVPFSGGKFSDGGFYQFQAVNDHIFGKEIWRLLSQLANVSHRS